MNTKFFFVLLVIIIAIIPAACAPIIPGHSDPAIPVVQPKNDTKTDLVPVTGNSAPVAAREPQEARRWSGEVFLSDNDQPDSALNATINTGQNSCTSADSQPRRYGGCVE